MLPDSWSIELKHHTPADWAKAVQSDFPAFLQDHADCERKASAMAMSFVYKAPDRHEIIPALIETALEEMVHFRQVYRLMEKRGILLPHHNEKDPYMQQLMSLLRSTSEERFMDRLLLASLVETRGAERFRILSEVLEDSELREFYHMLYKSEAKHGNIFVEMALTYYPPETVFDRLDALLTQEAELCARLPYRAALH